MTTPMGAGYIFLIFSLMLVVNYIVIERFKCGLSDRNLLNFMLAGGVVFHFIIFMLFFALFSDSIDIYSKFQVNFLILASFSFSTVIYGGFVNFIMRFDLSCSEKRNIYLLVSVPCILMLLIRLTLAI